MKRIFVLVTLFAIAFQSSSRAADAPTFGLNGGVPNLGTLKTQITGYYSSGRHDRDVATVDARLQAYVDARLKAGVKKPAVVFDIDDTSLSSYNYEKAHDFGFDVQSWNQWEHDNKFPAIAPTLQLVKHFLSEHVAVFFITGRRVSDRAGTAKELQLSGYPAPTGLYMRPVNDHAKSVIPFKSGARAAIESNGYDVLASLGDQWSDLRGGHAERLYKLPNPMYFLP